MPRSVRILVLALLAVLSLVIPFSTVAQAEGGIVVPQGYSHTSWVDTSNCPGANNCTYYDNIDGGTFFGTDSGGSGLRVIIKNSSGTVLGKFEFHPLDEIIVVCDARSDGFGVRAFTSSVSNNGGRQVFYGRAVSDGKCNEYNMDYNEGHTITFTLSLYQAGNENNYRTIVSASNASYKTVTGTA